jgi:hypothetical protein
MTCREDVSGIKQKLQGLRLKRVIRGARMNSQSSSFTLMSRGTEWISALSPGRSATLKFWNVRRNCHGSSCAKWNRFVLRPHAYFSVRRRLLSDVKTF